MKMIDQIREDLVAYRKQRYSLGSRLLQTFVGDLDKLLLKEIPDEYVVALIRKYQDNANTIIAVNRSERMVASAKEEIALLDKYLPKQLTAEQIMDIIHTEDLETGLKNVGRVMQFFKENYPGQYSPKVLSDIAKNQ